jgi:hypothetical protein
LKNLGITVTDETFEKFAAIQKKRKFSNQEKCLEHVIDVAYEKEMEDTPS